MMALFLQCHLGVISKMGIEKDKADRFAHTFGRSIRSAQNVVQYRNPFIFMLFCDAETGEPIPIQSVNEDEFVKQHTWMRSTLQQLHEISSNCVVAWPSRIGAGKEYDLIKTPRKSFILVKRSASDYPAASGESGTKAAEPETDDIIS